MDTASREKKIEEQLKQKEEEDEETEELRKEVN